MPSQGMSLCDLGMIEVTCRVMGHPDFFHDFSGPNISRCCERDDFLELQRIESVCEGCQGAFLRVAFSPMTERQAPTNLHTGTARKWIGRDIQTDESNQGSRLLEFSGPETKPILVETEF